MIKRLTEIFLSIVALLLLFLVFTYISLLVYLKMGSPVFFKQERIGKLGKSFSLYKFRSMSEDKNARNGRFDAGGKLRITPLGKTLRKIKLDELPQLINILMGDMSFVGPRPEVRQWTKIYPEKWKIVHSVKPGITDNASIEFRNEEDILACSKDPIKTYQDEILPRKLELYIDYVNNQSFLGDLKIILKTIKVVILK